MKFKQDSYYKYIINVIKKQIKTPSMLIQISIYSIGGILEILEICEYISNLIYHQLYHIAKELMAASGKKNVGNIPSIICTMHLFLHHLIVNSLCVGFANMFFSNEAMKPSRL